MKYIINKLPKRFQWSIHNLVAHPLMEITFQLGLHELSEKIHDSTAPTSEESQGSTNVS